MVLPVARFVKNPTRTSPPHATLSTNLLFSIAPHATLSTNLLFSIAPHVTLSTNRRFVRRASTHYVPEGVSLHAYPSNAALVWSVTCGGLAALVSRRVLAIGRIP